MPLINVKLIEGVFSSEQKHDIVRRLTDAMVEIEGEQMRPVTWVVVEGGRKWALGNRRHSDAHRRRQSAGRRRA